MRTKAMLLFSLLLCQSSCRDQEKPRWGVNRDRIKELIDLSQEQVVVDGVTLELRAYLYRDFMPFSPPDGRGLVSMNKVLDIDSAKVPDQLILERQFVIYGDTLWNAAYDDYKRQTPPYILERLSKDGPKWGPNVEVTVIAKLVDRDSHAGYFLRRDNQVIVQTF